MAQPEAYSDRQATRLFRGRRWAGAPTLVAGVVLPLGAFAIFLWLIFSQTAAGKSGLAICILLAALIFAPFGVRAALVGWFELVARVEFSPIGVALRLPRWHGILPIPPVRRLSVSWPGIQTIRRRSIWVRPVWIFQYVYIEYLIKTDTWEISLLSPARTGILWRPGIPAGALCDEIARRAGIAITDARAVEVGGFIHAMFAKDPPWVTQLPAARRPETSAVREAAAIRGATVPRSLSDRAVHTNPLGRIVSVICNLIFVVNVIIGVVAQIAAWVHPHRSDAGLRELRRDLAVYRRGDPAAIERLHSRLDREGHFTVELRLANALWQGRGVGRNPVEAARWARAAAEHGFAPAQTEFAYFLMFGIGVAHNDTEAVAWYRRAAAQGDVSAINDLGYMIETGRGIAKDEAAAVRWYRRAADRGNGVAMNNLGRLCEQGRGVAKSDEAAVRWYRRAAEKGNTAAFRDLARHLDEGRGVAADPAGAVAWYSRAAERGDIVAQFALGEHYGNGKGVIRNLVEAHVWLALAGAGSHGALHDRAEAERAAVDRQLDKAQLAEAERKFAERKQRQRETR